MAETIEEHLEESIFSSNLGNKDKVDLLQILKERKDGNKARENAQYLNRAVALILLDLKLRDSQGRDVVLPLSLAAQEHLSAKRQEGLSPVIEIFSNKDGSAQLSLAWKVQN